MTDDDTWRRELFDRLDREEAARLAAEKRDAVRRGKEPFDLDKFDDCLHPEDYRQNATREELIADYEYQYYVVHRGVGSIREFAELLLRLDIDKDK